MTTNLAVSAVKSEAEKFLKVLSYADLRVMPLLLLESIGMSDGPRAEYPVWVRRCAEKVNRARFPRVFETAKNIGGLPAYSAGLAFGLMVTGQKIALPSIPDGLPELTNEQTAEAWKFFYGSEAAVNTPSPDGDLISVEIRNDVKQMEADFSAQEQADFDQGKADAGKMILGDNEATATTTIYSTMLTFWRVVDICPTSQVLFDFLTRVLKENVVGSDPKRVQQLCRRIGKTFGKPGRPRKTTSA